MKKAHFYPFFKNHFLDFMEKYKKEFLCFKKKIQLSNF